METKNIILEQIKKILNKNPDLMPRIPLDKLSPHSLIGQDLGFDSIALMSLLYELQEIYPTLDENDITELKTINDLLENIIKKIQT